MAGGPGRLVGVVLVGVVLVAGACGSDGIVTAEPELVGITTVRALGESAYQDLTEPEVTGRLSVRTTYATGACGARAVPLLPARVVARYSTETVTITITPVAPDCTDVEDVGYSRGMEVFLEEPIGDRAVEVEVAAP